MRACGLIVEYNPFHNGHAYHIRQAKKAADADCIIAVMSGSFLQRGEPAIIDKFHRAKAALALGVDIVLELPYPFAVQSSRLFAKGAIQTLNEIGADTICFGSESGDINNFTTSYQVFKEKESLYHNTIKHYLNEGLSFPDASEKAFHHIGLTENALDLSQPNNILGYSYVKAILENDLPIKPLTIKRIKSNYHDAMITGTIASATSIRNQLMDWPKSMAEITAAMPDESIRQLQSYQQRTTALHTWEHYFPIVHYRVMTMSLAELARIEGVNEGIEHRIKRTAATALSFKHWVQTIKTKRYTWTRIQRMFVHILTNTKKSEMAEIMNLSPLPSVRLLGATDIGRTYLNSRKKEMGVPIVTSLSRGNKLMLTMEEKATNAYYSILPPEIRVTLKQQEVQPPIMD